MPNCKALALAEKERRLIRLENQPVERRYCLSCEQLFYKAATDPSHRICNTCKDPEHHKHKRLVGRRVEV